MAEIVRRIRRPRSQPAAGIFFALVLAAMTISSFNTRPQKAEGMTDLPIAGGPESAVEESLLRESTSLTLWDNRGSYVQEWGLPESGTRVEFSRLFSRFKPLELARKMQEKYGTYLPNYKSPILLPSFAALEHKNTRCVPQGRPTFGKTTSRFGQRISPYYKDLRFHFGVDIAGDAGSPIFATADGIVRYAEWKGRYGRLVVIDHGFGYRTYYGHNSELAVRPGETVRRGQVIAYMGSSGFSTGTHVHYEVWYNGRCINPSRFLKGSPLPTLAGSAATGSRG